jgi:hypothetical protein
MNPGTDLLGREWTQADIDLRAAVCERLHYSAPVLPDAVWIGARLLADGFGPLDCLPADVASQCIGDWSHVRDSSPEAFRAMHAYLRSHGVIA